MIKDVKVSHPKEAEIMVSILKEMGVKDYEPGVINQMLEFTYRFVSEILDDSRAYANYARKSKPIDIDDVKLAIQMMMDKSMTNPPPRDVLLELSRTRNSNPLPAIKPQCGIRLPPDRYCLSACNVQLRPGPKKTPASMKGGGTNPLKPNISMITTKSGTSSTVTLVQKSTSASNAPPSQKVVGVNRPIIKVSQPSGASASPKIQISSGNNWSAIKLGTIKTEEDELGSQKRKREEEMD